MTQQQRAWLDEIAGSMTMSTRDTVLAFIREFDLTPELAGEIIAQWAIDRAKSRIIPDCPSQRDE